MRIIHDWPGRAVNFRQRPSTQSKTARFTKAAAFGWLLMMAAPEIRAQSSGPDSAAVDAVDDETRSLSLPQGKVDVNPVSRDEEIGARIQRVLEATGWFKSPSVTVEEGVVFLAGTAPSAELKKWAGDLAGNTQDVVAVANRIEVEETSLWDFSLASDGLVSLRRDFLKSLPLFLVGLPVLLLSLFASVLISRLASRLLTDRIKARLLRRVIARAAGILVMLLGIYILLRILGLTQLALTVVGGTGLIGLIVGIAFRDITENFLASIFLSMQRPFETGDLIEVSGVTGYVQQLNMRTTVVMTLDGILVQIPNGAVYKSNIRNYTTNCNRREEFDIGIGYDDVISDAQEIARRVLTDHPAVLNDPEPAVLVNGLGTSTVNLRVYFWLDGSKHSWLKVRSSVIRLVKRAFQENGISMPDESREILFPKGIEVSMRKDTAGKASSPAADQGGRARSSAGSDDVSTRAEAGLYSEAGVIREQARQAQFVPPEENLLEADSKITPAPSGK